MMRHVNWVAGIVAVLVLTTTTTRLRAEEPALNTLSEQEKTDGWKLLFDGKTTKGWHKFRGKEVGDKWKVVEGVLVLKPSEGKEGGDIVTDEEFGSFELKLDWRVTPGGNSGVMYRVSEEEPAPFFTGPEYQILDNQRHADGKNPSTSAASCYALYAPTKDVTKPVGQWNTTRIVIQGNRVEHWLNGVKVVTCELGSEDWNKRVAESKFNEWKRFGTLKKGRIDLQDHGDEVAFRNIKIRVLSDN